LPAKRNCDGHPALCAVILLDIVFISTKNILPIRFDVEDDLAVTSGSALTEPRKRRLDGQTALLKKVFGERKLVVTLVTGFAGVVEVRKQVLQVFV
jgi:hypothetical protein